jgi:hypothetical protein
MSVQLPTTWMLKKVHFQHNACSLHDVLSTMIDGTSYNLLFVPWVWNKDQNIGFAFVNFLTGAGAAEAVAALRGKEWPDASGKPIEVRPAVVQGFEANMSARRRTTMGWNTRLLLFKGQRVCEEVALALYASRSFVESYMSMRRQTGETEDASPKDSSSGLVTSDSWQDGSSGSSPSNSLQDMIWSFGLPPSQPKRQPAAVPRKLEPNDAARQKMLEREMSPLGAKYGSETPSQVSTTASGSGFSHGCTTSVSSLTEQATKSAIELAIALLKADIEDTQAAQRATEDAIAALKERQGSAPAKPTLFDLVVRLAENQGPAPARTPSSGSSSGGPLPRRSLFDLLAQHGQRLAERSVPFADTGTPGPSQVVIGDRMSF